MIRLRKDSSRLNRAIRWTAPLWCGGVGALLFSLHPVAGVIGVVYGLTFGGLLACGNLIVTPTVNGVPVGVDGPDEVTGSRHSDDEHTAAVYVDSLLIAPHRDRS